jgi:hypothetical protein
MGFDVGNLIVGVVLDCPLQLGEDLVGGQPLDIGSLELFALVYELHVILPAFVHL